MPRTLAGWYVISLRPSGQHGGVRRAAAKRGARVFALSTLRLEALPSAALERALACPWMIATSPAAVHYALAKAAPARAQRWFAPGPGTAAALRRRGVAQVSIPADGHDSQHLLALPDLCAPGGRAIGLLTAPGGRDRIAPVLRGRGADVRRADVYERMVVPVSTRAVAALRALAAPAWLALGSGQALDAVLAQLPDDARRRLRETRVAAASPRLAQLAQAHGFAAVAVAASAVPRDLVAAIAADASASMRASRPGAATRGHS